MALDFTGNSQYLLSPNLAAQNGATAWTIAGWFYHDNRSGNQFMYFNKNNPGSDFMQLFHDATSGHYRTRWDIDKTGEIIDITDAEVAVATWQHYLCKYEGTNLRTYINGAETTNSPITVSNGGLDNLTWGFQFCNNDGDSEYFDGKLAEWAMWSRALSSSEIAMLQVMPPSRLFPDQLYLPMYEQDGGDFSPLQSSITRSGTLAVYPHPPLTSPWGFNRAEVYTIPVPGGRHNLINGGLIDNDLINGGLAV